MKLLLPLLLTLATAALVQFRLPDPISDILRLTSEIHATTRITLDPALRQGNNFDKCTSTEDCNPPRECRSSEANPNPTGPPVCNPGSICQCVPTINSPICTVSDDCDEGESCVDLDPNEICFSDIVIVESDGDFNVVDGPNPTAPPTGTPPTGQGTSGTTATTTTTTTTTTATTATTTTTTVPTTQPPDTTATTATQGDSPDGADAATPSDDDDGVCFPGSAVVHLANGDKLRMDELTAGHEVRHDELGSSSKIFLFTHRTKARTSWFYEIGTESGHAVTMTGNHYLYASGRLTAADAVRRGDTLRTVDGESRVRRIRRVRGSGLYAPHSLHGDLVVGGVVVSGYSRAVSPVVAHALLAPVRWLVRRTGVVEPLGGVLYGGGRGVENLMMKGRDKY